MTIATTLKRFFSELHASYHIHNHARTETLEETVKLLNLPPEAVLKAVPLSMGKQRYLAVFPLSCHMGNNSHHFELEENVTVRLLSRKEADQCFADCEPGSHPAIGEPYGLILFLDRHLTGVKQVYFESGSHSALIEMDYEEYHYVVSGFSKMAFTFKSDHEEPQEDDLNTTVLVGSSLNSTALNASQKTENNSPSSLALTEQMILAWHRWSRAVYTNL